MIAARTGIHGSNQHERTGKSYIVSGTSDVDHTIFKRLTHGFESGTAEFGKFVKKQHAVVGKTYLARHKIGSAANESHIGNGVMGIAERTSRYERSFIVKDSCHRVNLGGFKAFGKSERRKNGRQTLCHHRLAASRASHKQYVVSAGGCNFKSTLYIFLSAHICEIFRVQTLVLIKLAARINFGWRNIFPAIEKSSYLCEIVSSVNFQTIHRSRLTGIGFGNDKSFETLLAGVYGNGQCPAHRTKTAVETQFSHKHELIKALLVNSSLGSKNTYGNGQIITRTFLAQIGRSKINYDMSRGLLETAVQNSRARAKITLADSAVGQSHNGIFGTFGNIYLNFHRFYVKTVDGCRIKTYKHGKKFLLWLDEFAETCLEVVGFDVAGKNFAVGRN